MPNIISDSFSGANGTTISVHNPQWVLLSGIQGVLANNRARVGNAIGPNYRNSVFPMGMNYKITATVYAAGTTINSPGSVALYARNNLTGSLSVDGYLVTIKRNKGFDPGTLTLHKFIAGSATQLGTYNFTFADNSSRTLEFELNGTNLTIKLDSVSVITVSDSSITSSGSVGINLTASTASNTEGIHLDDFTVFEEQNIIVPAGGVTFSGTGNILTFTNPSHIIPAGGIILFSGTGNQANTSVPPYIINPSGGIVFSGTGNILNEKSPPHIIPTSGGIVFGGSAPMLFNYEPPIGGGPRMPLTGVGL